MLGLWAAMAVVLPLAPSLASLPTDGRAIAACAAALVFPLASAIADLQRAAPLAEPPPRIALAWTPWPPCSPPRWSSAATAPWRSAARQISAIGLGASALTHLLTAAAILLGLTTIRALAALRERPVYAEFWLATAIFIVALVGVVTGFVLPALSVTGTARWLGGVAMAATLALVFAGRGRVAGAHQGDGVLTALNGLVPASLSRPAASDVALRGCRSSSRSRGAAPRSAGCSTGTS